MEDQPKSPKNTYPYSNTIFSSEISQKKLDPNLNFDNKFKIIDKSQSESSLSQLHENSNSNSDLASQDTMSTSSKTTNESFVKNLDTYKDINTNCNSFSNNKTAKKIEESKNGFKDNIEKTKVAQNIHYLNIEEKILKPQFKNAYKADGLNLYNVKDGFGMLNYKNGNKFYEGLLLNNQMNGYGTIYYDDGVTIKFEGYFKDNMYHGPGKAHRKNASKKFEGNFENGYYFGKGTYFYDNKYNSIKYEGNWRKSKYFGFGTRYYDHNSDQKNKLDELSKKSQEINSSKSK